MHVAIKALCVTAVILLLVGGAGATAASLISGRQIKDGSITGRDVRNESLTVKDFRGSVAGPQGPAGLRGPAGPQGPQGPRGLQGAPGPVVIDYESGDLQVDATSSVLATLPCPEGYVAVGGGAVSDDETLEELTIAESGFQPDAIEDTPVGWIVVARNTGAVAHTVTATVACAKPTQVLSGGSAARRASRR